MTTCPSGVHYMHLVDEGRAHIERTYRRPFADRFIRAVLAGVITEPARFRAAIWLSRLGATACAASRAGSSAMIALRSASSIAPQRAISWSVRPHPMHWPV
jgi:glycolate oxidase iron-sulfur subunit